MKPIKKDARRQARRERALARLEAHLKGGVRVVKVERTDLNMGAQPGKRLQVKIVEQKTPFTEEDVARIQTEIKNLQGKLNICPPGTVWDNTTKSFIPVAKGKVAA